MNLLFDPFTFEIIDLFFILILILFSLNFLN